GIAQPERLVALFTSDFSGPPYGSSSYADVIDLRSETSVFAGVAAYMRGTVGIGEGTALRAVAAEAVSADYFHVLGVSVARGRSFNAGEELSPGDVVIVRDAFWRTQLGGAADAVGSTLRVNGRAFTVIGVTAEGFSGFQRTAPADVWIPVRAAARVDFGIPELEERTNRGFGVVARLAPGVSVASAQASLDVVAQRMHATYREAWSDMRGQTRRLTVLRESRVRMPPDVRGPLLGVIGVMTAAIAAILLIGCANIAGLLLTRAAARMREMGIRVSLGAGRSRLVQHLLTESLLLAAGGAAAGILLAIWMADVISSSDGIAARLQFPIEVVVTPRAILVTAGIACLAAVLFGLAPALHATRVDLVAALKGETKSFSRRGRVPLRGGLVVSQIALSLVLLIGALLFARAVRSAYAIDPGYPISGLLMVPLRQLPGAEAGSAATTALALTERARAVPGVRSASWGTATPLAGYGSRRSVVPAGYTRTPGEDVEFHVDMVGPGFFETFGIDIVRGRALTELDRAGSQNAAVVSESYARRFWPGADPIGNVVRTSSGDDFTIVGIARDVRFVSLIESPRPRVFLSALQEPGGVLLHVRTSDEPMRVLPAIADAVEDIAPGWAVTSPRTLENQAHDAVFEQRLVGGTIGAFAFVALLLAAIGIYGVVALAVAQRTREVGVRMALGATAGEIRTLFVRRALAMVTTGLALGLAAAWAATRLLGSLLIDVSPHDPFAFAGASILIAVVAFIASQIPARIAGRVDPLVAIRTE
ncbi:MAG: ADOP family duplicated permease, partial [Longimicrobiales bacterium]